MKMKRPPPLLRALAYLNRNIPAVRFGRKILARFFGIQLDRAVRGRGYQDEITLQGDTRMFLWLDEHVDTIIWWQAYYEKLPSLAIRQLLKTGERFVDVGANIGYYSLIASDIVGDSGEVIAFEPVSKIFRKLSLNASGHNNITTVQSACGEQGGTTDIYVADDTCSAGSRISAPFEDQSVTTERIHVVRLDEAVGTQRVDMVKIDVEGYEIHALRGMAEVLRRNPDVKLFVEVSRQLLELGGSSPEEIFNYLKSFGLLPWQMVHQHRRLGFAPRSEYWHDENLILFARKEAMPGALIVAKDQA